MCDCIQQVNDKVKEHFNKIKKENETLQDVVMTDSALMFGEQGKTSIETVSYVRVKFQREFKSGKVQDRSMEVNMTHKFCPFCGEKYQK